MENENKTQNKSKKIAGVILNVFLWLFVIFAVMITIITVSANANKKNVPVVGGNCYLSVQSDSMNSKKPEWANESMPNGFKKGDLIFGKYIADNPDAIAALKKGDVITFEWDIDGNGVVSNGEYNTHRIVNVVTKADGSLDYFETQGDNADFSKGKTEKVYQNRIIAVYSGRKIGGLGAVLTFLGSSLGFGLCIILPIALFFVYEIIVFVKTVMKVKNEGKKTITAEDEELIRQRAVEEYIKRQQLSGDNAAGTASPESDK